MNRKVKYVRFHTGLYAPGAAGDLGNVLPPINKTLDRLEMSTTAAGLFVKMRIKGEPLELLIPYGNVIMASLELEEPKIKAVANG